MLIQRCPSETIFTPNSLAKVCDAGTCDLMGATALKLQVGTIFKEAYGRLENVG